MLFPGDNGRQGPLDRFALFVAGLSPVTLTVVAITTLVVGLGTGLALGVFLARGPAPVVAPPAEAASAPAVERSSAAGMESRLAERPIPPGQYTPPPLPGPASAPGPEAVAPSPQLSVAALSPALSPALPPALPPVGGVASVPLSAPLPASPEGVPVGEAAVRPEPPPAPPGRTPDPDPDPAEPVDESANAAESGRVSEPALPLIPSVLAPAAPVDASPTVAPADAPSASPVVDAPVTRQPPPPPPPPARWATPLSAPHDSQAVLVEDGDTGHVLEEKLSGDVRDPSQVSAAPLAGLPPFPPVVAHAPGGAPWRANAIPIGPWRGPAIAIVIDDLGVDRARTRAVAALPGPVTMAFLPYAEILPDQMREGRKQGHELLIHMPMEPQDSRVNPGPDALKVGLDDDEILARLKRNLDRGVGYVGINNHMGSRFTTHAKGMAVVMAELKRRGLLWIDSVTSPQTVGLSLASAAGVPHAGRAVFLDNIPEVGAVDKQLAKLEAAARSQGTAIGIGHPKDATIQALRKWLPSLAGKGITLVPVSALVRGEATIARRP